MAQRLLVAWLAPQCEVGWATGRAIPCGMEPQRNPEGELGFKDKLEFYQWMAGLGQDMSPRWRQRMALTALTAVP